MPYCVICRTRFYERSFSSDSEPCDCGACISHRDWQDMDGDAEKMAAFDAARKAWRQQRAQEQKDAALAREREADKASHDELVRAFCDDLEEAYPRGVSRRRAKRDA